MTDQRITLNARDIEVLITLIDPANPKGNRRTQSEVSYALGYDKSTVSRAVSKLIRGKFIRKKNNITRDALYITHTNYDQAISQVTEQFKEAYRRKLQLIADRGPVVTHPVPLSNEMLAEPFTIQAHSSGSVPIFNVLKEGLTAYQGTTARLDMRPFKNNGINGSANWSCSRHIFDYGRSFYIRYQRTANKRLFYVSAIHDIESLANRIMDDPDAPYDRIVLECYPMLNWLTKYAGWKFETDQDGNFVPLNEIDPETIHLQVNHQPTTDFLKDHVGPFTAPGVRADASGDVLRFEVNADRKDYITALVDGPVTRALAIKHDVDIEGIKSAITDLKGDVYAEIYQTWQVIKEVQQEITALANIQNIATRTTNHDMEPALSAGNDVGGMFA